MNMAQDGVLLIILFGTLFIWLSVLSFFLWRTLKHYNTLTRKIKEKSLTDVLEKIIHGIEEGDKRTEELSKQYRSLEKDGMLHAQKFGLLRFNPFNDTGGDQSFILALLDGKDNGVVISSLHSRTSTRWYAKKVVSGKGSEHALSDEEQKAIKNAKRSD